MSFPPEVLDRLLKREPVIAPIKAQLDEHIAWVSIIPDNGVRVTNPDFIGYAPNLKRPAYKVFRFEMSHDIYNAFKGGSDIDAREDSTKAENRAAETVDELESILQEWRVDFDAFIPGVGSGYPRP